MNKNKLFKTFYGGGDNPLGPPLNGVFTSLSSRASCKSICLGFSSEF